MPMDYGQQGPLEVGGVSHRPWCGDKSLGGSPVFQVGGASQQGKLSLVGIRLKLELESLILQQRRLSPGWPMPPSPFWRRGSVRAGSRGPGVARPGAGPSPWRGDLGRQGRCVPGGSSGRLRVGRGAASSAARRPRPAGGAWPAAEAGGRAAARRCGPPAGLGSGAAWRREQKRRSGGGGHPGVGWVAPLAERTGRGPRSPPCRRGPEARRARAEASGGRAGLWRSQRPGPGPDERRPRPPAQPGNVRQDRESR